MFANLKVNKSDSEYQIWTREPLSIEIITESMFIQKLEYIHYNPVTSGLCKVSEEYYFSSVNFILMEQMPLKCLHII